MKKPHERSLETGFLLRRESGDKGRAKFSVCRFGGARVFPREAMEWSVCGSAGAGPNPELVR